jgi:hypothetical protein
MRSIILVGNLALASLFVAPACVDTVDAIDDSEDGEPALGTTEATLSSLGCPYTTPADLAPAADQDLAFVLSATGVQKYTCAAGTAGPVWTFVAPYADLFSYCGEHVGTHYAGPAWEYEDGSIAFGAKVAGVTVDPTAVPWLLLTVTSHTGPTGKMSNITSVQRLATTGGNAPATGCDAAHLGANISVPYTASYYFYRTRTTNQQRNTRCGAAH